MTAVSRLGKMHTGPEPVEKAYMSVEIKVPVGERWVYLTQELGPGLQEPSEALEKPSPSTLSQCSGPRS